MNFYYKGPKRPSKGYDLASGCLLVIGLSAIIFFLTMLDSLEDLKEYSFQLILVLLMAGSVLYGIFRKKGKRHYLRVQLKNNYLQMGKVSAALKNINLDVYQQEQQFIRYHLWDTQGKIAIYSVFKDDLLAHLETRSELKISTFTEQDSSQKEESVLVHAGTRTLHYNLDGGDYTIKDNGVITAQCIPNIFAFDGKYKK